MAVVCFIAVFTMLVAPVLSLTCVEGVRAPQCNLLFAGFLTCQAVEGGCITVRPPLRWVRCTTPMVVEVESEAGIDLLGKSSLKIGTFRIIVVLFVKY